MSALPKPVLRGHIQRRGLKMLFGAISLACFNGALYHFMIAAPKKNRYYEFLKTYDAEAHYEILKKGGYLQSAKS